MVLKNIRNDCHQQLSDRTKMHRNRFRPGLRSGTHWESIQRSPDPLPGLRGTDSMGTWRGGRKERERGRGKEKKVRQPPPLFRKFLGPPMIVIVTLLYSLSAAVKCVSFIQRTLI